MVNPPVSFIGFVPHRLDLPGMPELSNFPYNILFPFRPDIRYHALYLPHIGTYEENCGLQLMTYLNTGDPEAKVIILYDPVRVRWHGEKFYQGGIIGQADGTGWDMFFFHLTILGCDRRERMTGPDAGIPDSLLVN